MQFHKYLKLYFEKIIPHIAVCKIIGRQLCRIESALLVWIMILLYQNYHASFSWEPACLTGIHDGDTISFFWAQDLARTRYRGRLLYIDAFELEQKYVGKQSARFLKKLLAWQDQEIHHNSECHSIMVQPQKKDLYGRELIVLKRFPSDLQTINAKMIINGQALVYPQTDWGGEDQHLWEGWQKLAQNSKVGAWKLSKNKWLRPWSYRKKFKSTSVR